MIAASALNDDPASPSAAAAAVRLNFVLLGDAAVGKSSLALRFADHSFAPGYKPTEGLDLYDQSIPCPNGVLANVRLWDISGSALTNPLITNCLNPTTAHVVVLVYDMTHVGSFQNLEEWLRLVYRSFLGPEEYWFVPEEDNVNSRLPIIILAGNKSDLASQRTVDVARHAQFASDNKLASCFVSAKTGDGVQACFTQTALHLLGYSVEPVSHTPFKSYARSDVH
ncbi:P-loop containing nucleoside triphosphate hydrolase protein [Zopfochytrium polystomum]|nr:P-loop containing nucleoside triphosphate hydrolase protein [Zopfochytrium polystomum]